MTNKLILIVEDDHSLGEALQEILSMSDAQTELIRDGGVAQNRLKEIVPDLVILDIYLPNVHGDVLLKQIRNDPRLTKTRVVIASADKARAEATLSLADMVLVKPINYDQLDELLEWASA